jgi:hypothetical protein
MEAAEGTYFIGQYEHTISHKVFVCRWDMKSRHAVSSTLAGKLVPRLFTPPLLLLLELHLQRPSQLSRVLFTLLRIRWNTVRL